MMPVFLSHSFHNFGVSVQDPVRVFWIYCKRPVIAVEGASEEDSVGTREHMAGADVGVIDLGLREEYFQLSADRYQFLIAEQSAGTQAAAIKDHGLTQSHDLFFALEIL